jgi:hypothetical protein
VPGTEKKTHVLEKVSTVRVVAGRQWRQEQQSWMIRHEMTLPFRLMKQNAAN